jgi:hypothetical protein
VKKVTWTRFFLRAATLFSFMSKCPSKKDKRDLGNKKTAKTALFNKKIAYRRSSKKVLGLGRTTIEGGFFNVGN